MLKLMKIQILIFFHSDKTTIVVACSKNDFENIEKTKQDSELIIVKANPLCETIQ